MRVCCYVNNHCYGILDGLPSDMSMSLSGGGTNSLVNTCTGISASNIGSGVGGIGNSSGSGVGNIIAGGTVNSGAHMNIIDNRPPPPPHSSLLHMAGNC